MDWVRSLLGNRTEVFYFDDAFSQFSEIDRLLPFSDAERTWKLGDAVNYSVIFARVPNSRTERGFEFNRTLLALDAFLTRNPCWILLHEPSLEHLELQAHAFSSP
jgi:hypothetical protein